MNKTTIDVIERTFWTAVQAGLAVITVDMFDLPKVWIPVLAIVLAALKSVAATQVGVKGSAAMLPSSFDSSYSGADGEGDSVIEL